MVGYYRAEQAPNPVAITTGNVPHLETMNPVKSLVCSPDLTVFGSSRTERITTSNEERLAFRCLLCQESFSEKSQYQSHLRSHGKEGEDPYCCNICGKTFAVPARLTRHFRTHTGEKPFECEFCKKSFSVKENLSVHRRIHTKERPYKCNVCERAFEHSGKLHRHMRIHTGERPHACKMCSKTFIQSGQLVIHMRTHTGEKPYVCKACNKGFTCSKQLKVHTRTHTGEKPYKCEICGKSFGYNHVLKLHQVAHYGEKVYKCTLCHETFSSKKTMEMHIKTHSENPGSTSPRDSLIEPVIEISQNSAVTPKHHPSTVPIGHPIGQPVHHPLTINPGSPSDKENSKTEDSCVDATSNYAQREFSYYLFPRDQYTVEPPATPVNTGSLLPDDRTFQTTTTTTTTASTIDQSIFVYPEVSPGYSSFILQSSDLGTECPSLLDLPGNDARRRVEAALEAVEEERQREFGTRQEPILTPPSSNPVSPAPSPDPLDLAIPTIRETLILPPRKRCKMILESMESEKTGLLHNQRQSSVIHFARAS